MKILYEDAVMLAAVKPQGMPAQADKTGDLDLLSALEEYTGQPLGLLHRLDRPVGGVMLFAKEKRAEAFLAKEIQEHRLKKSLSDGALRQIACGGRRIRGLSSEKRTHEPFRSGFQGEKGRKACRSAVSEACGERNGAGRADLGGNRAGNRQASPDSRPDFSCRRAHLGG